MDLLHTKTVSITDCPIAVIRLLQQAIEKMNIVRNASEAQAVRWGATQWALQIERRNDLEHTVSCPRATDAERMALLDDLAQVAGGPAPAPRDDNSAAPAPAEKGGGA